MTRAPIAKTDTKAGDTLQAGPITDPQDPLPESNWRPRRWSSFAVCLAGAILLGVVLRILWRIASATPGEAVLLEIVEGLITIAGYLILVVVFDRILLMVAPSAEQVVKMLATAGMIVRGVSVKSETRTRATPRSAETITTTATELQPDEDAGRD